MKSALLLILFTVFSIDVSGADFEVSVMVGDSVTLHTDIKVQTADVIKWDLNKKCIAMINEGSNTFPECDEELKARLQLYSQTGDLQIRNIKTKDSGDYKLEITTIKGSSEKTFSVSVKSADAVKPVSLMEGDSVTVLTGLAEIQRDDVIVWMFGDTPIAKKLKGKEQFIVYKERFGDRLKLDHQNGSLNITNTTNTDSGPYDLQIRSSRYTINRRISVNVTDVEVPVMAGDSVTLHTNFTIIRNKHTVSWFDKQENLITGLTINDASGDLTIRNIQSDQSGHYEVNIIMRGSIVFRRIFHVNISGEFSNEKDGMKTLSVKNGESILLTTHVTEIQNVPIEWIFVPQNISIVKTDGKSNPPLYSNNERFKNILDLNNQTGDLSINNSNTVHSGVYQLKIINRAYTIQKSFNVTVKQLAVSVPDQSSSDVTGIVVGVIVLVAAVTGLTYYCIKKRKQERHRENGQNHRTQDTVDPVNEETILNNDS